MSEDTNLEGAPAAATDSGTTICNWLIVMTFVFLLCGFFIVESILARQYQMGMLK